MRKDSNQTNRSERSGLRTLGALALATTIAAFGCTTNRTPGAGEPVSATPAAGPMAPASSATPGSESAPAVTTPTTMVSSSPTAPSKTDPIAEAAAARGYQGVVLGPAAPGTGNETASMQQSTGQFISPSMAANPQVTINSSISSAPTTAIVSGAGEGAGGATGVVALPAGTGAITSTGAVTSGITNSGVTGATNTTATGIAGGAVASGTTGTVRVGSGLGTAPAVSGNVIATPTLGTSARLNVDNTAATAVGGSTLGVTTGDASLATGLSGGNQSANGRVVTGTTPALSTNTSTPVATTLGVTNAAGTVVGSGTATVRSGINNNTRTTATSSNATATGTGNIRVVTNANGTVTMTNTTTPQARPSVFRRALRAIGIGRNTTATSTTTTETTTPSTTTTTP